MCHVSAGTIYVMLVAQFTIRNTADDSSAAGDCFNKIKEVYLSVSSAHRARVIEKHLLSLLTRPTEG